MSESPPNLPTPDFTDNILLPGEPSQPYDHLRPSEDLHDNIHHQLHEEQHQQAAVHPPPLKMTPHQKIPLPPAVTPKRPAQNSSATPQAQQLGMFQDIPAKQDYQTQTSKLERHYFPETASSSAPNLSEGAKTGGGGHEESDGAPQNIGVNSVPQPPQSQNLSSSAPNQKDQKSFLPPSPLKGGRQTFPRGAKPLNFSPEQSRGGQSQRGSRGGRGRGKGGGNWNMTKERKISQPVSYYAYTNSSTKTNIGRPHSFNTPKVNPENRQNLFGRTLPVGGVAPGNRAMPFSWQQRGGTMPVHIVSPPPIQKQNWSPDRSRPSGEFQTRGKKLERPRSYSEGIMLESNSPSQERRKSNPSGPPESQNIGPQYSQYYLGRSPGAPRRDQQNYFPQNDRTQTLNLTWTSPRLHHDPAISGQAQPRPKMSFDFGSYSNASSNSRPKPPNLTERSKTAQELGFYGNSPQTNRNKANVPLGARKLSTNQSPGRSLHIPAQGGQSSRV